MCCVMGQTDDVLLACTEPLLAKTLGTVTPRKPVLSVSARKIKDNAADWHNLILKWETLNDGGFATANNIANMTISLLSKDKIELASSGLASDNRAEKEQPEYSRELETLCEELQTTLESLTKIQMKMEKLSSTTKGVCELEDYHYGGERGRPPLFHTWPTAHFSLCGLSRDGLLLPATCRSALSALVDVARMKTSA
ncbi:cyclin-dependent kinase 2-interacting protein isoform X3 [Moschus berezovskii]|uniref:cyclin-dependent kinase 2-interacting protein isoform X3 n=1 Tax=Moschus berezovskii TaxID=68408 RepID=UPI0024446FFF|nr:cyclin-dependent kinase 2-interacting protein isoform X3 [Moschus berezovskii]